MPGVGGRVEGVPMKRGVFTDHASPKFIAPSARGLTLTAADGERIRCLPRRDLGGGAGSIVKASSSDWKGLEGLEGLEFGWVGKEG